MTQQNGMIQYRSRDSTPINAFFSAPATPGPHPGVIVIMEAFGLVDHIKDVARRFSREGYLAIAPDLYTRTGPPDPSNIDSVIRLMRSLPDAQAIADLEGAAAYLNSQPTSNKRIGVVGFCSGGRHTLLFACNSRSVHAAIDCYGGRVVTDELTPAQPKAVVDMIGDLNCAFLGLFGEEDQNPNPQHVAQIERELKRHRKTYDIKSYPNAGHAFFADYRPSYREHAAKDAWQRMLDWYGKYLKTPQPAPTGRR